MDVLKTTFITRCSQTGWELTGPQTILGGFSKQLTSLLEREAFLPTAAQPSGQSCCYVERKAKYGCRRKLPKV